MLGLENSVIEQIVSWSSKLGLALIVFVAFIILGRVISGIMLKTFKQLEFDSQLSTLFARVVKLTLNAFGIISAFGTLGIDVSAMVAGLGLTGFALGFALKDTITNLLAGVLILLYKPFDIANIIQIASFKGKVISIDLRYTQLDDGGNKVLIPNAKLFTDPIVVFN